MLSLGGSRQPCPTRKGCTRARGEITDRFTRPVLASARCCKPRRFRGRSRTDGSTIRLCDWASPFHANGPRRLRDSLGRGWVAVVVSASGGGVRRRRRLFRGHRECPGAAAEPLMVALRRSWHGRELGTAGWAIASLASELSSGVAHDLPRAGCSVSGPARSAASAAASECARSPCRSRLRAAASPACRLTGAAIGG